jgi:N-acetylneuraminate synthase
MSTTTKFWDMIGAGRCLIIGEVGLVHEGSLGLAHKFIDAIADAGADAVKFQTHIAEAEGTAQEQFRVKFSQQDATRADYWRRTAFTAEQWATLAQHARERSVLFLSTPFSHDAADLLRRVGVAAWKIASGETNNRPLLEDLARDGLPVLLSTGMSDWAEIEAAVDWVRSAGAPVGVFQCTTAYPCPPERIGLNVISQIRRRLSCPAGLSDHSGKPYAGLAAATLGLDMLEVHVTLSPYMFGPDVSASVTSEELRMLVDGIRWIEAAMSSTVDKDLEASKLAEMRRLFNKSVVARRALPAGSMLTLDDLTVKKPGIGIPASCIGNLVGKRLTRDVAADTALQPLDIEGGALTGALANQGPASGNGSDHREITAPENP